MTVLVTGADGFIGRHLLHSLRADSVRVHGSTLGPVDADLVHEVGPQVEWHRADMRDASAVAALVESVRPQQVYHLAGFSSGARARSAPREALRVNAEGTLNLLCALSGTGSDARVLVASSGDVYGRGRPDGAPISETAPLEPENPYAASKAAQEIVARGLGRHLGIEVIVARPFPLLGPGQSTDFVLPSICLQVAEMAAHGVEPVLHVGDREIRRDFTDVRDGVSGLRAVAEQGNAGEAYNVASGRSTSIGELIDLVIERAGIDVAIREDPARLRPGEPREIRGDAGKLARLAGWGPERPLASTVADTYEWALSRTG